MSPWRRPCVICRRERPVVFAKRLAPFGVIGFCARCRRAVLEALLEAGDPHTLSELFTLLRFEDAERRERPENEQEETLLSGTNLPKQAQTT